MALGKINDDFGKRLKDTRIDKNLSQERLGELADLHRTYIGMVERGEKNITLSNIKKISIALNVTLEELFKDL
jgi:transcriptional regulator with XRE-family HTH domain